MKRKLFICMLLCAVVLSFAGCGENVRPALSSGGSTNGNSSENPDNRSMTSEEVSDISEIVYEEGVYPEKDWENVEFSFEEDCIPDKEAAVSMAELLLGEFQQQKHFINYVLQSVFYDTEDCIWIVTFAESGDAPGACVSMAIRKSNAEVVKVWMGE